MRCTHSRYLTCVPLLPPVNQKGLKHMKRKTGMQAFSLLLALLLVSVVLVPAVASEEEQIKTNLLFQNQEAEKNIYTMLGVEHPSRDDGPQWQKYNEARAQVDELLIRSESKESVGEIIGYLEGKKKELFSIMERMGAFTVSSTIKMGYPKAGWIRL